MSVAVQVGDVVEWSTRGPVTWVSPDGRHIQVQLPDGQTSASHPARLAVALDLHAVTVLAPDVRAGDVWVDRSGQLWHALQSPGETGALVVLLYPAPGGPGRSPEEVHELPGLERVVFRSGGFVDGGPVGTSDETAVLPRVEGEFGDG